MISIRMTTVPPLRKAMFLIVLIMVAFWPARTTCFMTISSNSGWFSGRPSQRSILQQTSALRLDFDCTFLGDFDNYLQVLEDRQAGKMPREGGGHEHIHCTLMAVSTRTTDDGYDGGDVDDESTSINRLAAFYFDGNPNKIFRFRYYQLEKATGRMKLFTLHPDLEQALRACNDPLEWNTIYTDFCNNTSVSPIQELPNCDVEWSTDPDPIQHDYLLSSSSNNNNKEQPGHHAVMTFGQAIVESTLLPGTQILVRDQLSLWENEFWIHDRGYNPDTMDYIYGNQAGIPYQLQRVCKIVTTKEDGSPQTHRQVVNSDLAWTLGDEYRTPEEYEAKLKAMEGVSSKLNSSK